MEEKSPSIITKSLDCEKQPGYYQILRAERLAAMLKDTKPERFFAWLGTKGDRTDAHRLAFPQGERSSIISDVVPE